MFTATTNTTKSQRKRKSSENEHVKPRKEDLENQKSSRKTRSYNRGAKKKVLEEANNSKLRQNVQVRVEDCLQNGQKLSTICRLDQEESNQSKTTTTEDDTPTIEEDITGDSSNASSETRNKSPIEETPPQEEEVTNSPQEAKSKEEEIKVETKTIQEQKEVIENKTPKEKELPRSRTKSNPEKRRRRSSKEVVTPPKGRRSSLKEETTNKCEEVIKEIEDIIPELPEQVQIKEEFLDDQEVPESLEELREEKIPQIVERLEESDSIIEELREIKVRIPQEIESEEDDCVIVEDKHSSSSVNHQLSVKLVEDSLRKQEVVVAEGNIVVSVRDDDEGPLSSPFGRMELGEVPGTALLRFPDDRSDSGVSSLRSGSCASGDERSGSRSSALSSSDEPQQQHQQLQDTQQNISTNSSRHDSRILR